MATESLHPPIDIPEIDTWDFLFEGKRAFPDDKGKASFFSTESPLIFMM
jgi:hypothetical protein